jgi:hypothetical protein
MIRVLQIKCHAQVSGERERERCEDLERPVRGEMTRVFLSRQSKTILKGFLLVAF